MIPDYDETIRRIDGPRVDLFLYGRRTRRLITVIFILFALNFALSIVVARTAHEAKRAVDKADSVSAVAYTRCITGNSAKTADSALWAGLLALEMTLPMTPGQQVALRTQAALVATKDAQQDCAKLYGKP